MRFGRLEFTPGRWPTIVTLLVFALLMSLGFWQLNRADQKRALLARYHSGAHATVVRIDARVKFAQGLEYETASATGSYDAGRQFLLDNRTHDGVAGYQVLTPLKLGGGDVAVLVNRGWVPLGASREVLPATPVGGDRRTVIGRIKVPSLKGFHIGGEEPRRGWPYRIQRVDTGKLSKELGYRLLPLELLLDPSQPDGYVREWHPLTFGPERNVGYAVQWFCMAAVLMVIYLMVNSRKAGDS